jgi:transcriptional regulator with XRE-family HTH domain
MTPTIDHHILASVGRQFRDARKRLRVSQIEAARQVGCTQSQVSGCERGMKVLGLDKIEQYARFLDINLDAILEQAGAAAPDTADDPAARPATATVGYCASIDCPANVPSAVRGNVFYDPSFVETAESGATHCRHCGEPLVFRCSNKDCDRPVAPGRCCQWCGAKYIDTDHLESEADLTAACQNECAEKAPHGRGAPKKNPAQGGAGIVGWTPT